MRRAMNRTVGDKTHESPRYGSFLTVERPSRKGFDRLGLILIRQALEGRLPLFTESPRRLILGNWVSGVGHSRKPNLCHYSFLETPYVGSSYAQRTRAMHGCTNKFPAYGILGNWASGIRDSQKLRRPESIEEGQDS